VNRLLASLDAPPSGRERAIWFDAADYGRAKLLAGAAVPWDSPAELTSFVAKLQGMFRSDAILAGVGEVFAQRAAGDAQLRAAMAARTRPGYALRTLLAADKARGAAAEAVRALAATTGGVPLVLAVPAPARWLSAAAEQAGSDPGPIDSGPIDSGPIDSGRAETAAMYVADMLRTFGSLGVDGLLLDEGSARGSGLIHSDAYRSVLNVADHYGWPVLIRADAVAAWPHGGISGVTAWLGSAAADVTSGRWGVVAGAGFWDGDNPAPDAELVLVPVPPQADPEAVMKRVRALS
jgi:hypothetical protein